ncbi:hypothetical protein SBA4_3280017 [Candidatus Sulfopaludibacter sp. SbA4]|nr:hypothetical protein SBA4_3280017 [Candidatus Sulfopaludibacter sp. SbA4]
MPPGRYTMRLTPGGRSYTQALEVKADPGTAAAAAKARSPR